MDMRKVPHNSASHNFSAVNPRIGLSESGQQVSPWFSNLLHKTFSKGAQKLPWPDTERPSAECLNLSVSRRPGRRYRLHPDPLPWRDRVAELRGQLTLIVHRAERGLPVSIESLARAERVARSLELAEVPV